jgi:hypothetical protein
MHVTWGRHGTDGTCDVMISDQNPVDTRTNAVLRAQRHPGCTRGSQGPASLTGVERPCQHRPCVPALIGMTGHTGTDGGELEADELQPAESDTWQDFKWMESQLLLQQLEPRRVMDYEGRVHCKRLSACVCAENACAACKRWCTSAAEATTTEAPQCKTPAPAGGI